MPDSAEDSPYMIAVMGPTGSGKSKFIKDITGDPAIHIGHSLESDTDVVKLSNFFYEGQHIATFVDTPGFDDSRQGVTDADVLKKIAAFLKVEHSDGRQLAGIIYLHRISDPRMGGVSRRNFRMFRELCGTDSLKNVIVVTTFWDAVTEDVGTARMMELETNPNLFKPIIDEGGKIMKGSAYDILHEIISNAPMPLEIQIEMEQGKDILETKAGQELDKALTDLIAKHKEDAEELQMQIQEITAANKLERQVLLEEHEMLQAEMERWKDDKRKLMEGLDALRSETEEAKRKAAWNLQEQREALLMQIEQERSARKALDEQFEQERSKWEQQRQPLSEQQRKLAQILRKLGYDRSQVQRKRIRLFDFGFYGPKSYY